MIADLWKKIKKQQFSSVYLLFGTENFILKETKQLLIQSALGDEEADFNLSVYDLEETSVEAALEDAETLPFIGERRVVVLNNPVFLTAERTKEKIEHDLGRLEAYLNEPSPFSILVFIAPYEKLDERKKITKLLKKQAEVLEANGLNEQQMKEWIRNRAGQYDVHIAEDALDDLISLTDGNLMMLTQELDKLALYSGQGNVISSETVHLLVPRSLEQNIFSLVEKVVQRKVAEALRIFYDLLRNNEEPIKILSLLVGQFRLLFQVKELSKMGYGQQQIASAVKVHPYRVKLAAGQGKNFTEAELLQILDSLAEADYQMKMGKMDKKLILEMFLMKLGQRNS